MKRSSRSGCKIVLLVENNPSRVSLICYLLLGSYQVEPIETLQSAMQQDLSKYDLILLDLILPDSREPIDTFLKVFREVRIHRGLNIPIVVISAVDDIHVQSEILNYGVSGYINKGEWNWSSFNSVIESSLNESFDHQQFREYQCIKCAMDPLSNKDIKELSNHFVNYGKG